MNNNLNIEMDFKNYINLLKEKEDQELYINIENNFVNKLFITSNSELDLYIKYFPQNSITISRISFNNKRVGNGTKLLELCKSICNKYGFDKIIVESVCTDEMAKFCISKGFNFVKETGFGRFGNYELCL